MAEYKSSYTGQEIDAGIAKANTAIQDVSNKVDKVEGKGLSTNDFTDEEKTKLDNIDMSEKQDTLVSGTNIKTINNTSILGSGNITIGGSGVSPVEVDDIEDANFAITDDNGKLALAIIDDGHIKTKKFDSSKIQTNNLKILFIGNSLTQDAVSYVPLLLDEIAPDIEYTIYDWYNAGANLAQQYTKFVNNEPCAIFGTIKNKQSGGWTCDNNTRTMSWVCENCDFDIVVIQEYSYYSFNDETEITNYNNIIKYINEHYDKPFKVYSFIDAPMRTRVEADYARAKSYAQLQLANTVCEGFVNPGSAIVYALDNDILKDLGDRGELTPDGTHAQEGLPCMLEAYVVAEWLFSLMGIPKSIYNSQFRMTAAFYSNWQTIGANLGSGVVEGTEAQYLEAQRVAIRAYKYNQKMYNDTINNLTEGE